MRRALAGPVSLARVGGYFIVDVGGDQINELSVQTTTFDAGDWLLALSPTDAGGNSGGWTRIDSMYGGGSGGGGATQYLDDLLDVDAPTATTQTGQLLGFDGTTAGWRPYNVTGLIDWSQLDWNTAPLPPLAHWPAMRTTVQRLKLLLLMRHGWPVKSAITSNNIGDVDWSD